ncbi:MAG: C45 family peptidase [Proteobacteria bacterium]|nr:C45 family peptidase [Pseudomonadota bacterium]MBU4576316.1 C45 family peptidase [Pseudomonadota bacterium]MBU4599633.1 C45 family peptidase [Pseudomonadota bacterium]MBV1716129.1 C45 family peptidase [Desulfarculus sp.]MBV1751848.1 C45 family peptidase [Desulfarculus sp.]
MIRRCLAALLALALLGAAPAGACTLWAAVGSQVAGGGTLAAKNRDWNPASIGRLERVRPAQGMAYLALMALGKKGWGVRAGVNQAGLTVLSASASAVPKQARGGPPGVSRRLLAGYSSVRAVLEHKQMFDGLGPRFYLLADARQIAVVEIAPGGAVKIASTRDGLLTHTNHYLSPEFAAFNQRPALSSHARLARVDALTAALKRPLTLDMFREISEDRGNGPDNSLWRTGSKPKGARTLASFLVRLPPAGAPEVWAVLANPGQAEQRVKLILDENFWRGDAPPLP